MMPPFLEDDWIPGVEQSCSRASVCAHEHVHANSDPARIRNFFLNPDKADQTASQA